ncbi:MAG: hypothetical protein HQL08_15410 [Nitrospirae bacterium]|nr:hypothetical protein [Nitrospirota bacterium]
MGIVGAAIQTLLLTVLLAGLLGRRCSQIGYKPLQVRWHTPSAVVMLTLGSSSLVSTFTQNSSDTFIRTELIKQAGAIQNGFYQAALVFSNHLKNIVLGSVHSYSVATLAQQHDPQKMSASVNELLTVIIPVAALSLGFLGIVSYPILSLLYAPSFVAATNYMPFLLGGDFLQAIGGIFGAPLLALGHAGKWLALELTYCGVRLLLSLVLLPIFGGPAIAAAYMIATFLFFMANVYIYLRLYKLKLSGNYSYELVTGLSVVVMLSWMGTGHFQDPFLMYLMAFLTWLGYATYKINRELGWSRVKQYAQRGRVEMIKKLRRSGTEG